MIEAPSGDAELNNYTLFYDTNNAELALGLAAQGVPARWVPTLREALTVNPDGTGQLTVVGPAPFTPQLSVDGPVGAPASIVHPLYGRLVVHLRPRHGADVLDVPRPLHRRQRGGADGPWSTRGSRGSSGTTTVSSWPVLTFFDNFPTAHMQVTVAR